MEFVLGGDIWVYQVKETLTYSLGTYHLKDFSRNPSTTKRYLIMKLFSNVDSHTLENNGSIKQFYCHRAHCISIKLPYAPNNKLVPRYTYYNHGFCPPWNIPVGDAADVLVDWRGRILKCSETSWCLGRNIIGQCLIWCTCLSQPVWCDQRTKVCIIGPRQTEGVITSEGIVRTKRGSEMQETAAWAWDKEEKVRHPNRNRMAWGHGSAIEEGREISRRQSAPQF